MDIKGFNENDISEKNKKALQSETWQKAKEAMIAKREIKHFSSGNSEDNAYGATWAEAVNTYLKTEYKESTGQSEIEAFGITYKVLKRNKVTTFYDVDGNTLFDVENERLASEYEWWMNALEKKEEAAHKDCQIRKRIEESGEDLKCSADISDTCGDCDKAALHKINEAVSREENSAVKAEPAKDRAKKKLKEELKKAKDKSFAEPIIGYLLKRCEEDKGISEDIVQEHKTWEKCFIYIYSKAKKQAKGNCAAVRYDVVYEWAEDYYRKDDKAEEEDKAKKAAEAKKKSEERATKAKKDTDNSSSIIIDEQKEIKKKSTIQEKKELQEKQQKPKKTSKDMDGQLDMFSIMGI